MRIAGHSVLAILAASAAMYVIGALIYGLLFSEAWMALSGYTKDSFAGQEWRMALSPVMPVLIAVGLSMLLRWRGAGTLGAGLSTGVIAAVFFLVSSRLYMFVYGVEPPGLLALDALHMVLIGAVGGAILGVWPKPKAA
ncbi:MAG: DUF1761 domain-containing protein [Hyphomonadaceae bacterium]|nr:DUF1761 domain-containing protein [Hyphomonadaceae bacterium]